MDGGRVAETDLMPNLVGGYTELGGSKLKNSKGFLKPNYRAWSERRVTTS